MYWVYRNHQPVRSFHTQTEAIGYAQARQEQEDFELPRSGKWTVNYQGHDIPIEKPVCVPLDFLSPSDRVRIENYQRQ